MSWHRRRGRAPFPPAPPENSVVIAISNGDRKHLLHLLQSGADANAPHRDTCPLVFAALRDEPETVACLLAHGAEIDSRDAEGRTALMRAAEAGLAPMCVLLLGRDANVNAQDRNGNTALLLAACAKRHDAVALLVAAGADPALANNRGESPETCAARPEMAGLRHTIAAAQRRRDDGARREAAALKENILVKKPLQLRKPS